MTASVTADGWQLDATALPAVPRTYVQQNFTSCYAVDTEGIPRNDLAFRLHANGLCGEPPSAAAPACRLGAAINCVPRCALGHKHKLTDRRCAPAVVALAPSHAALGSGGQQAASAPAATPADRDEHAAASDGAGEAGADQQMAAAAAAGSDAQAAEARLDFSPKLLQAEFRKGRGPLLHADTILGR